MKNANEEKIGEEKIRNYFRWKSRNLEINFDCKFLFLTLRIVWNSDFKEFRSQSIIVPSLKMSLYPSKNLNIFMVFLLSNKTKSHCAILNKIEYFWIKEEKTSLSFFKYFWKKTKKKVFLLQDVHIILKQLNYRTLGVSF